MNAPKPWWRVCRGWLLALLISLPFSAHALLLGETLKVARLTCNTTLLSGTNCTTTQFGSFLVNGTNSLAIGGGMSITANDTQIIISAPAGFTTPASNYDGTVDYYVYDDNPARPKISSVYNYNQVGGNSGTCGVFGHSLLTNSTSPSHPGLSVDLNMAAACSLVSAMTATFTLSEAVTLGMSLTAPSTLAVNNPAVYSALVQNTDAVFGLSSLVSYVQMPAGFQFGSITPNNQGTVTAQAASCAASGQLLTCTLALPAGGFQSRNGSVGFDLTLLPQPASVNTSVVVKAAVDPNGANAAMTPSSCTANGSPAGCAVTPAQTVVSNIRLGLSKSNPAGLAVGAVADYAFTVTNTGSQASGTTVVVYDQLPANVQWTAATPLSTGSVTPDAVGCTSSGTLSTGLLLTCTLNLTSAQIPPGGGTADFSISVTPQPAASGANLVNKAALDVNGYNATKTPSSCVATGNPAGCAVTPALSVGNGVALSLAKTNPAALNVGALASYGLVLTNNGTAATTQSPLTLSDQLPPNVQYTSVTVVTPPGGSTLTGSTSCSATGTVAAGQLVTCSLYTPTGGIPANGGQVGINLNVTPQAAALGTSVSNKAAVDAGGKNAAQTPSACTADGQPAAGCAVTPALSVGKVQLALSKTNPASLSVGDPQDYSLTLSNSGSVASSSTVVVTDQLPANLQYTAATPLSLASAVSCTAVGQVLTCSVTVPGGIPAGGQASFSITVTPLPAASGTNATNKAYVDPTGGNATPPTGYPNSCTGANTPVAGCAVTSALTVGNGVALSLAKTNPAALNVGALASYGLVLTNNGTAATTQSPLTLSDQLPPNVQYTSVTVVTPPGGSTLTGSTSCSATGTVAAGQLVTCSLYTPTGGIPANGGQVGINLNVTPQAAALGTSVSNKAAVDTNGKNAAQTPSACTADGQPAAGCAVTPALSVGKVQLALSKTNPASLAVGDPQDYSFTLSNSGSVASNSTVVVTDQLPANLQYNSATPLSLASAVSCTAVGQVLTCSVTVPGGIPAGGQASFSLTVTPLPAASGSNATNKAYVDPNGGNATPPTGYPNSCTGANTPVAGCAVTPALTVGNGVALSLAKTNPAALNVGALASYGLVLSNNGTAATTQSPLTLSDQLPPNVQYTSVTVVTPPGGSTLTGSTSCSATGTVAAGQLVTCSLYTPTGGIPANGGQVGINLNVTPQAAALGTSVSNKAAVDTNGKNAAQTPSACTANGQPAAGCAVTPAMGVGNSTLRLSVLSSLAGTYTFNGNNGWASQSLVVASPGGTVTGAAQALTNVTATTLTLASNVNGMLISAVSCSGMGTGALSSVTTTGFTLSAQAVAAGNAVSCQITLVAPARLSVTVSLPSSANATLGFNPDASLGNGWASTSFTFSSSGSSSLTSTVQNLSALGVPTRLNQATPSPSSYTLGAVSCVDGNAGASGNPAGSFVPSTPAAGAFQIDAAYIRSGAQINCAVAYWLPAGAGQSTLSLSPAGPLVAGAASYTALLTARDANGAVASGSAVTFNISATGGSLSATSCTTATSGANAGSCSVTLSSPVAGTFSVAASLGGTAVAGTLTASALDAQGNLNTTTAVTFNFSTPGAGATLSASSCTTVTSVAGAGTCSVTVTATVAGSYAITATTGGVPVGGTNPVTAVFVAATGPAAQYRLSLDNPGRVRLADGRDAYVLTAGVYDASGRLNVSQAWTFDFILSIGTATGRRVVSRSVTLNQNPDQWIAMSEGRCTAQVSGPQAGSCSVTVTATLAGWFTVEARLVNPPDPGMTPAQAAAQFVAGPAVASRSVLQISDGVRRADGQDAHTVTVTARDAAGNVQGDSPTVFVFDPPGPGSALGALSCSTATSGPQAGSCSVVLKATTPGSYAITASLGGAPVRTASGGAALGAFVSPAGPDVTPVPMLHPMALLGLMLGLPGLAWATRRRPAAPVGAASARRRAAPRRAGPPLGGRE